MLLVGLILLAALAVAALAVIVELGARWWIRSRPAYYVRRRHERFHLSLHPDALPDFQAEARVEVNAEGERGDPLPASGEDFYRVLVAGGSAAECGLLDQRATWPALLQELLSNGSALEALGAPRVHVGNIGRSMMTCEAVLTLLERTLPRYEKLDLLVLMVGMSDLVDWLEKGAPSVIPEGRLSQDEIFGEQPETRFAWSPRRLAIRRIISLLLRRVTGTYYRKNVGRRFIELRRRRQNARRWIHQPPDPTPMLTHFEKYFRRIVALAKTKGARVVFVRQPWFDRELTPAEDERLWCFSASPIVYEKPAPADYYTHEAQRALLRICDRRWAELAAHLEIEQVDLRAVVPAEFEYLYDELHFTEAGARLAAKEIGAVIVGSVALRAEPKTDAAVVH